MEFIKKHILVISGMLIGALAGFLYWRFVGCVSGTCAITSNPVNSTIYGFVTGGLIFSIFKKDERKLKKAGENEISGDN
ncbi:MAG: hypothetical protein H3C39_11610 [Flavobacteriia bacterium]|nr:hypothetical protein [Flavobacteriia bacterium]